MERTDQSGATFRLFLPEPGAERQQTIEEEELKPPIPGGHRFLPSLWCAHGWDSDEGRLFLMSRGISEGLCRSVPIWWAADVRGLAVQLDPLTPEYSPDAYVIRPAPLAKSKWMTAGLKMNGYCFGWNAWQAARTSRTCLLVEGIFDLLSTGLYGWGVACMGTSVRDNLAVRLLEEKATAVIWFDADEPGRVAAAKAKERLRCWGVPTRVISSEADPKHYRPSDLGNIRDFLEKAA